MADYSRDEELFLQAMSNIIRKLRLKKEYDNQEDFATDHDYGRSRYQAIEGGANLTTVSILRLLSHYEGIEPSDFMKMVEAERERLKKNKVHRQNFKVA